MATAAELLSARNAAKRCILLAERAVFRAYDIASQLHEKSMSLTDAITLINRQSDDLRAAIATWSVALPYDTAEAIFFAADEDAPATVAGHEIRTATEAAGVLAQWCAIPSIAEDVDGLYVANVLRTILVAADDVVQTSALIQRIDVEYRSASRTVESTPESTEEAAAVASKPTRKTKGKSAIEVLRVMQEMADTNRPKLSNRKLANALNCSVGQITNAIKLPEASEEVKNWYAGKLGIPATRQNMDGLAIAPPDNDIIVTDDEMAIIIRRIEKSTPPAKRDELKQQLAKMSLDERRELCTAYHRGEYDDE